MPPASSPSFRSISSTSLPSSAGTFGTNEQFPTLKDTRGNVLCGQPRGYVPCGGDDDGIPDDEDLDDDNDGLIEIWSLKDLVQYAP